MLSASESGDSMPVELEDTGKLARAATLPLAELAQKANEAAKKAEISLAYYGACAGVWLIAAKSQVKHGDWSKWLAANFDRSERVARRYMEIAEACKRDPERANKLGVKTVRGLLEALGRPQDGQKPKEDKAPNRPRGADLPKPDPAPPVLDAEFQVRPAEPPADLPRVKFDSLEDSPVKKVEDSKPLTSPGDMASKLTAGQKPAAPPVYVATKPIIAVVCPTWVEVSRGLTALVEKFGEARMKPGPLENEDGDDPREDMYGQQEAALRMFAREWAENTQACIEDERNIWIPNAKKANKSGAA